MQQRSMKNTLKKSLGKIALAGSLGLASVYGGLNLFTGATFQDYFGGSNKANVFEDGEEREIVVPVYNIFQVGPSSCSKYARLVTESFGNHLNRGNAWDLCKSNSNLEYNESSLKKGDLVLFYNPKSSYQKDGRTGSHVAVYLGMDKFNRSVYAEQRGIDSKITTSEQFKNEGWIPKKIILPKKS